MPIYEYSCPRCDKTFTLLQKMGAISAETTCPDCGGSVRKQISTCAIGSGSTTAGAAPACSWGGG
jgi:putative FmdB family regulatory protein